ncbi:MAG TPA: hypothetical protein VL017_08310, partial [Devosia sp.]|nr:hypothetical protein [Devosia sp.]
NTTLAGQCLRGHNCTGRHESSGSNRRTGGHNCPGVDYCDDGAAQRDDFGCHSRSSLVVTDTDVSASSGKRARIEGLHGMPADLATNTVGVLVEDSDRVGR